MEKYKPTFKLSNLTLCINQIAMNADQFYKKDDKQWQDREDSQTADDFSLFVKTWDQDTRFTVQIETSPGIEIYSLTADDVPFAFKRVDNHYTLSFDGHIDSILQSTFDYFAESIKTLHETLNFVVSE